jgi:DNA-binding transcriptional MerR regulator
MEYTVRKLAKLAGVSTRTLRYYDEIDLLKPARINTSGYRIYGADEIDRLQQILFYKEMGVELVQIQKILEAPDFDELGALREHLLKLLEKKKQINQLIDNVNKTIRSKEKKTTMKDQEKFQGFKKQLIKDNEEKYGQEIREKYGKKAIEKSNAKMMKISEEDYNQVKRLEEAVLESLKKAFESGNPAGEEVQRTADLHRQWLSFYWDTYSKEAHMGVAEMYVADERFSAYYDPENKGMTKFLRDAIKNYVQ